MEGNLPTNLPGRYILSVKRTMRETIPPDWLDQTLAIPGICLVGERELPTVTIDASADALAELTRLLGEYLNIEPFIPHRPLS